MDFEFLELKLISGNEVHFKKKYRLSNNDDRDNFFYFIENKVGWKKKKMKGKSFDGDNWWQ